MKIKRSQIFNITALFIVLCSCDNRTEEKNAINATIAEEFKVDSGEIVYQYYQKFGFTDLCEDIIQVSSKKISPNLSKFLPMNKKDFELFRKVTKVYSKNDHEQLIPNGIIRGINQDVELEFSEYITDTTLVIKLKSGEYEIEESKLHQIIRIFDEKSGLYFIEVHRCDGN